ncbi:mechanosensitive ion channel family protein [Sunxiuqinia elliptica]|uniref:Small conductance mechanosensitive channel n=1 Tax=Sunxiuqinia elliptica TaxID=655355 RepID=A0A4R6H445_9BACT|nr:mechanosensitive ion channel family protein [Sunxiuqinia elliptica]TDO02607.1 small conductance mechanosensitive channel [Sunxiuqinia elliptica]TDO58655.1 small conductance mechanosensitive channel [Sunxiuqinia elliptica]
MEKLFTDEFWETFIGSITKWLVTELPAMLFLIVLLIIALRTSSFMIGKLKNVLAKRTVNQTDEPNLEVEKRLNTLMGIVKKGVAIFIWTIFIMIFLKKINIDIAPLLAGAGIVGLAVGFGAQELVRDFITGFFILLENQIRTGDVAIINGTSGLVEKIELRTITLRDLSGTVHVFQNGKINTVSNMTKGWSAIVFDIGVAYKENLDRVMEIMSEVAEDLRQDQKFKSLILEPMEIFGLDSFGDSALVVKGRIKTKPIQQWVVGREYRKRLKEAFDKHKIEIPFPHRTIYWGEEIDPLKLTLRQAEEQAKGQSEQTK